MSSGITPSERLLYTLCQNSFLNIWSYANVFRNQGNRRGGDGKELCDVLVVFDDNVLLFSDRSCEFPKTNDILTDWNRWSRRAVESSKKQLRGAQRWITQFPDRVFLNRECTQRLHVDIPSINDAHIYKIAVANGASERCKKYFNGGSGSLIQIDREFFGLADESQKLFAVPMMDSREEIFHVLDDVTLPKLLQELDTISDFVSYLETKENLIRSKKLSMVHGEEDLMGLYLGIGPGLTDVISIHDEQAKGIISEGIYADIVSKQLYQDYKVENSSSYLWDHIIEHHTHCLFEGTLIEGSTRSVAENEKVLRILASESRLSRRILADSLIGLIDKAPNGVATSRTVKGRDDQIYVFQVYPHIEGSLDEYRRARQEFLEQYCILTGWRNRNIQKIIGISCDGKLPYENSYDIGILQFDHWSKEMIRLGEMLDQEMAMDSAVPLHRTRINIHSTVPWQSESDRGGVNFNRALRQYKKRKPKRKK